MNGFKKLYISSALRALSYWECPVVITDKSLTKYWELHVACYVLHYKHRIFVPANRRVGKVIFYWVAVELVIKVHVFSYKANAILKVMVHRAIRNDDF